MIIEAALVEELTMHCIVMATISGGIVVKRKYIKGYRPHFSKIRIVKRKGGRYEAKNI